MSSEQKVVDNFELVESLLTFNEDDTFYHLQVIRRNKDHPNLPSANRTIKTYFIDNKETLPKIKDEIIKLCEIFGARAYINLNPKSYKKCALNCISDMSKRVADGDFKKIYKQWNSVAGYLKPNRNDTRWIIDIDFPQMEKINKVIEDELFKIWSSMEHKKGNEISASELQSEQFYNRYIYAKIPTKGGYHLITRPFDLYKFNKIFDNKIDVHKNNPTLLYIPIINKFKENEND